jgi:hypothetical protein
MNNMNNDSYMNNLQNHEMTMHITHKCQTHIKSMKMSKTLENL